MIEEAERDLEQREADRKESGWHGAATRGRPQSHPVHCHATEGNRPRGATLACRPDCACQCNQQGGGCHERPKPYHPTKEYPMTAQHRRDPGALPDKGRLGCDQGRVALPRRRRPRRTPA